ncbi:collagen-binding protein [Pedobacter lusitanus]|uniref:Collagen-binding protein n=1 Tax=Pedobacter lusitanus TaxID=1503925 RepID=A0A0D0GIK1_9SPHI|nr:TonB-dependent receptor [Pedobacter lusitanus]KIO77097.1 collagen-binding protein [Pedobacter lusitanus]
MKKIIVVVALLFFTGTAYTQNIYKALIKDAKTNHILPGAILKVEGTQIHAVADSTGLFTVSNIPAGKQLLEFSYTGFEPETVLVTFPVIQTAPMLVLLKAVKPEEELDEVTISATRGTRTISSIPTRVEVIAGEELDEKGNMKPGDIRMMLAESTGIQTQQTSAISGNSSIRIQGLDGKYTQLIRDGFPLYSGFSGGLGLLQIAPLDLQQVEVIKGSSSTLYGGGAIAGLVNLVSKKPTAGRQLNFLLNGTSALGLDLSSFYAQKFNQTGVTVYAAYNKGTAYDPAAIGLTAIPEFDRFTLNPKMFFYFNKKTTLSAGLNLTHEKRLGGDLEYIKGNGNSAHTYFEENKTDRYSTQVELEHKLNEKEKIVIRNAVSYYDRSIRLPDYLFSGAQLATYSEANYTHSGNKAEWIAGLNLLTDNFREHRNSNFALRSYNYTTIGAFIQHTWNVSGKIVIESGIRSDYHNDYGLFFLPRISALWKIDDHFSTRLSGGLGYKAPGIFTEDAERIQFRNVLPVDVANTRAERSYGANYDINYHTAWFDDLLSFSVNQLFFYTRINNPILLNPAGNGNLEYVQPKGNLNTKGIETNAKFGYRDFKLFIGYTMADVNQETRGNSTTYALVSRHRLNNVLMYELEDQWKIGAEAYYFSKQRLSDGSTGRSYWTAGLMAEKLWKHFSVFMNFENLTDVRQTKFDAIYSGSITSPVFKDIYAPVDGFVMNSGVKIKL